MKLIALEKSGPIQGICKQSGLWAEVESDLVVGYSYVTPLVYFQKPKWIDEDVFKEIIKALTISLPKDFKLKHAKRGKP